MLRIAHRNPIKGSSRLVTLWGLCAIGSLFTGCQYYFRPVIKGQIEVSQYTVSTLQNGQLLELRVKEGDYVELGDTLALLMTKDTLKNKDDILELIASAVHPGNTGIKEVDRAYSFWQQSKAAVEQARQTYNNIQRKYKSGRIPMLLRDNAFTDYKALQAQEVAAKKEYVAIARNSLLSKNKKNVSGEIAVIAKVEGEVSKIYVRKGEQLKADKTLMDIALLENVWGTFILDKAQSTQFREGDTLRIFCQPFSLYIPMRVSCVKAYTSPTQSDSRFSKDKQDIEAWEMQVRPILKVDGLREGMKLIVK